MALLLATVYNVGRASAMTSSSQEARSTTAYIAVERAVCYYFPGSLCWQAMSVVKCETGGTYSVWAGYKKHSFWGLFQMGASERAKYGHGWNAWAQARAARAYYNDSGWSPWQCMPGGGLRW